MNTFPRRRQAALDSSEKRKDLEISFSIFDAENQEDSHHHNHNEHVHETVDKLPLLNGADSKQKHGHCAGGVKKRQRLVSCLLKKARSKNYHHRQQQEKDPTVKNEDVSAEYDEQNNDPTHFTAAYAEDSDPTRKHYADSQAHAVKPSSSKNKSRGMEKSASFEYAELENEPDYSSRLEDRRRAVCPRLRTTDALHLETFIVVSRLKNFDLF
eukprot:gene3510-4011_t